MAPAYLQGSAFPDSVLQATLTTVEGEKVLFSEVLDKLQGQTTVLWFWASWCGDSHADIPKLKKLQKKLKDKNMAFLLLSKDENHESWKDYLSQLTIAGQHYRLAPGEAEALMHFIDLDWIPRYVVLDEKGKVVVDKAVQGKDKKLKNALLQQ